VKHVVSVVEFVCDEILLDLRRCFTFFMVEVCLMAEFHAVLCWRQDVMVPWLCYVSKCYVSRCYVSGGGEGVRQHDGCEVRTFDLGLFVMFDAFASWVVVWFCQRVYGVYARALVNIYARCVVIMHGHWLALMQGA